MRRELFWNFGKVRWTTEVIHLRLPVSNAQVRCVFCLAIVQNQNVTDMSEGILYFNRVLHYNILKLHVITLAIY